jgi:radical SAM superfamily enzyme YgiQ (UPF0313 family)
VIVDDLAFSDMDRASQLADGLIGRGIQKRYWAQVRADNVSPKDPARRKRHHAAFERLAEAGLDMVLIGLESFDAAELKRVNKGSTVERNVAAIEVLRDLGVKVMGAQIVFPNWDIADFDRAIEVNQRLGIEVPQFTILTPLPGTPDYERALQRGELLTLEPAYYDFYHSVLATKLPLAEFYRQISRLYRETGWWATAPGDGKRALANSATAKRSTTMLLRDVREGWTDLTAVKAYAGRMEVLRDERIHLRRLEDSDLYRVMSATG